jgi:hypothetical protein
MSVRLSNEDLDQILALQFSVAWAGESGGEPRRLGWWQSDLIDADAGGDLFARLLPRTHEWAGLSLARRCAVRVDAAGRGNLAAGDRVQTLFHLGFEIDEQLCDRVAEHRRHRRLPKDVLRDGLAIGYEWSPDVLAKRLGAFGAPQVEITTGGRRLRAKKLAPLESAQLLAAALLPLAEKYPLPYLEASG